MTIPAEQGAEVVELLRRAITHTAPCGFEVVEKWRAVAVLFGVGPAVARELCKRFDVDPNKRVPR